MNRSKRNSYSSLRIWSPSWVIDKNALLNGPEIVHTWILVVNIKVGAELNVPPLMITFAISSTGVASGWWVRFSISNKYSCAQPEHCPDSEQSLSKSISVSTFWPQVYIQWCQRERERPQSTSIAWPPPAAASTQEATWPRHLVKSSRFLQSEDTRILPMPKKQNHGLYVPIMLMIKLMALPMIRTSMTIRVLNRVVCLCTPATHTSWVIAFKKRGR